MRLTLFVAILGLAALGCRSDDPKMMGGDDDPTVDAPPGTMDVSIKDIQMGLVAEGTAVKVEGVVVTAVDTYGARTGDVFVQEPEGGAHSGLKVFGVPLDQVAALQVGDVVTITNARVTEYRYEPMEGTPWPEGQSLTELEPVEGAAMQVIKTGTMTPVATDVDALAIEMLATPEERDAEWEKWEGVLINVKKARQTTEVTSFGDMADDQKSFRATGRIEVQSAMSSLPSTAVVDTCYADLVGVVDYFFSYKLAPRSEADLVGGGTDCAVLTVTEATISEVQSGAAAGEVLIKDVYVTAIAFNKRNLWVSQSLTAAPNEGLFLFRSGAVLPAEIVPGAKVNVRGRTREFAGTDNMGESLTQLENATVEFVSAPTAQPTPVTGQQAATLTAAATGESYESVLVTLTNVKLVTAGMPMFYVSQMQQGATQFLADDDIGYRPAAADQGTCYATVTGIWTYQVFEDAYGLLPISATGTGTCP